MKWRKVRDFRQRRKIERLIEVAVDVLEHLVHAPFVLGPAVAGRHETLRREKSGTNRAAHRFANLCSSSMG